MDETGSDGEGKMGEVLFHLLCYIDACRTDALRLLRVERYKKEEVETIMFHSIAATVLFVKDMAKCKEFYRDTLGLKVTESDPEHVAVHMDNVYFLLLEIGAAAHMVSEQKFELNIEGGPRGLLAAGVEDIDATYETLSSRGVRFLRPPTDQPWGLRTAYFADPEGNLWEINQPIGEKPKG